MKLSQQEIDNIFKFSQWSYRYESTIVEYLTPNPHVAQSLIAAALNTAQHWEVIMKVGEAGGMSCSSSNYGGSGSGGKENTTGVDNLKIKLPEGDNNDLA